MNRTRTIIFLSLLALLVGGALWLVYWLNRPLAPALALEVTPRPATSTLGVEPQATQAATQAATQTHKTCGETGRMRLLVIGRASPISGGMYGADAIRLVVVDFDAPSAAILALPPKLWVDTPALASLGVDRSTLELVFQEAWQGAPGEPDHVRKHKATQALAQTIIDNFEFVPDHYLTIEEDAFVHYVDELGGISITLDAEVDGTPEGYGVYPQGPQVLDGLRALNFTRLLHPVGGPRRDTWGSLQRQNLVLRGLWEAATKPDNLVKAPKLVRDIYRAITTDLSLSQVFDLTCMVGEVGDTTRMLVVSQDMVTADRGRLIPDLQAIHHLIQELEGGT